LNYVLCLWCSAFFGGGGMQFAHELHWTMVSWRADGDWRSPVGVVDLHHWSWFQASVVYLGCVHMIQVQFIAESSSVWSRVFCIFQEKKSGKKGRNRWQCSPRQTSSCASPSMHQDFPNCYVQLKAILRIGHWILCALYVSAVI
jgi:hypothetical protein